MTCYFTRKILQYSWDNKTSEWKFSCQHGKHHTAVINIGLISHTKIIAFTGARECDLNKLHACILQHFEFDDAYTIISCLMRSFRSNVDDVSVKNSLKSAFFTISMDLIILVYTRGL